MVTVLCTVSPLLLVSVVLDDEVVVIGTSWVRVLVFDLVEIQELSLVESEAQLAVL